MSKGLRVFGHPAHAVLSDFPLAFLSVSLFWDVVAVWRGEAVWWAISFWNIALGLAFAALAALAGFFDYAAIKQNDPAQKTATTHLLLMSSALMPFVASLLVRGHPAAVGGSRLILVLLLDAAGALLLAVGGWYGGHLVFHHGVGGDRDEREKI